MGGADTGDGDGSDDGQELSGFRSATRRVSAHKHRHVHACARFVAGTNVDVSANALLLNAALNPRITGTRQPECILGLQRYTWSN